MGSTLTTAIPGATQRFQGKETPRMKYGNLEKHVNQKLCVRNRTTTLKPCSREGKEQPARKKLALLNWSRPRSCAFAPVADVLSLNLAPKQPCSPCVARQERNPLLNEYGATTGAYSPGLGKEELLIRLDANSNFETCRCPQAASPIHVSFAEIAYIDQSDSSSESATSKDLLLAEAHVGTSLSSCHCRPRENPPSRHGPNSKGRFGRPAAALPRSTPHSMYDLCSDGNGYSESKVTTGTQTTKLTKIGRNKKSRSFPRSIGVDCPHPSVQASTSQLLRCFGIYLYRKCRLLKRFSPQDLAVWLQRVDHTLLVQVSHISVNNRFSLVHIHNSFPLPLAVFCGKC
uniref:Uncharacterized protein n=1 Tax=Trichuris muris TaxID=70415 RepID=A0A5S6QKU9_TRIMR